MFTSGFESIRDLILGRSAGSFEELALSLFAYQSSQNLSYARYIQAAGLESFKPQRWSEIPLMRADSFKRLRHYCSVEEPVLCFRSSGTTDSIRSEHHLSAQELELYELSLWASFSEAFPLVSTNAPVQVFFLSEPYTERLDSSLFYMFECIRGRLNQPESAYLLQSGSFDLEPLRGAIKLGDKPILLLGTAYAFAELLEKSNEPLSLPAGSALMETGGFKTSKVTLSKQELYASLSECFALPESSIVGQYGMSELGSQYYDQSYVLGEPKARMKLAKPWCQFRILRPTDLSQDCTEGELGLIAHYDLTNCDSLAFILSQDLGRQVAGGFELIGRAPKAVLQGCSLDSEAYLTARREL